MSDELRMDLADTGSPEALAAVILRHYPEWQPPVPLKKLAFDVGITDFEDFETNGFVGALITDETKSRGIILTQANLKKGRRRFTIAHELGHFLIPSHRGNKHCTPEDLREMSLNTTHRKQEAEANRFAANVLMPKPWMKRDAEQLGEVEISHLQILAKRYQTSLEATINRYIDLTDDRCAFIFSKDNVIRYARPSRGFPKLGLAPTDQLPTSSATIVAPSSELRTPTVWFNVDSSVWLETSWGEQSQGILEQSMRQQGGHCITLLFVAQTEEPEDEGGPDLEETWTPRFRR